MFYVDEKLLSDNRALITTNETKEKIGKELKSGTISYCSDNDRLWLTTPKIRKNYKDPLVHEKLDRIITARDGINVDGQFNFNEDQTFDKNVTIKKDLLIEGNLNVLGDTTVVDTPSLSIEDNVIELNRNETGNGITLERSGVSINRGDLGYSRVIFDETNNSFVFDKSSTHDGASDFIPARIFLEDHDSYKAGDMKLANGLHAPNAKILNVLDVDGTANIENINILTKAIINGTLNIKALTSISGNLNVTGASVFNNNVIFNSPIVANEISTFNKKVSITGNLEVDKSATFNNNVSLTNGQLSVFGDSVFESSLSIKKNLDVEKNANINGEASIKGNVTSLANVTANEMIAREEIFINNNGWKGISFYNDKRFKIFVTSPEDNADSNMHFKSYNGTDRGFKFINNNNDLLHIKSSGEIRARDNMYSKDSLVLTKAMEGSGNGMDADMVDGKHSVDLILRDGTQEMKGDFNLDTHKIKWNSDGNIAYEKVYAMNGNNKTGVFKFTSGDNIGQTAIEAGAIKAKDILIDGETSSISKIDFINSKKGSLVNASGSSIIVNEDEVYSSINLIAAVVRSDRGFIVGNNGNHFKVDSSEFKYKGENVLTTAGTSFMNGNINMASSKLRFSKNTLGLSGETSYSEIYTDYSNGTELNIVAGKGSNDKISFKKITNSNSANEILLLEENRATFRNVPYHNEHRILTVEDEGHGKNLDADTLDGKHYSDLTREFINATGDTMDGNLFFSGISEVRFGDNKTSIQKNGTLKIKSDVDIDINSGVQNVKICTDGTVKINDDRVLTIADEGHENMLDADTLDMIHASQFVRRDTETTMEADINIADKKIKFLKGNIKSIESGIAIETINGSKRTEVSTSTDGDIFKVKKINSVSDFYDLFKCTESGLYFKESKVWNEGNLTPSLYEKIEPTSLANGTNMDTVINTGKYICGSISGVNSYIDKKPGYIEIIKYSDQNILQRISSICGSYIVQRAKYGGAFSEWVTVASKQTDTQEISLEEWKEEFSMYYKDITHDLVYKGITSVLLTDYEGFSIFTGFKEMNNNTIRIFSASRIAGRVTINTNLN